MTRKQIDQILAGYKTYQFATPACKRHFANHLKRVKHLMVTPMDVAVRDSWMWFWRGWFRQ